MSLIVSYGQNCHTPISQKMHEQSHADFQKKDAITVWVYFSM